MKQEAKDRTEKGGQSTTNSTDDTAAALRRTMVLLQPLLAFHEKVPDAGEDDLRIYWDVRLVRGADTPLFHTSGSSSLPGYLGPKLRPLATAMIQQEVEDKITSPLVGKMQKVMEDFIIAAGPGGRNGTF